MSIQDIMDFIACYNQQLTVVGTVLSSIAAVFGAYAAFSSARSARLALNSSEQAERRLNIRTALTDAHTTLIECDRMKHLASELKLNYQSLATFSGAAGGSRDEMYQKAGFEKYDYAQQLASLATELIKRPSLLDALNNKEIDEKKVELSATLFKVMALREQMADELSNIRLRNSDARNAILLKQLNPAN